MERRGPQEVTCSRGNFRMYVPRGGRPFSQLRRVILLPLFLQQREGLPRVKGAADKERTSQLVLVKQAKSENPAIPIPPSRETLAVHQLRCRVAFARFGGPAERPVHTHCLYFFPFPLSNATCGTLGHTRQSTAAAAPLVVPPPSLPMCCLCWDVFSLLRPVAALNFLRNLACLRRLPQKKTWSPNNNYYCCC